ncbi:MAG: amidase family protein, partial [Bacteroidota bacterium]
MKPFSSLKQIQQLISAGDLSCRELVLHYLNNIQEKSALNAFLEVYAEEALSQAAQIDDKFAQGTQGRLAGAIIGLKDVICYENHPLQCSSKMLEGFQSQFSATVVERLLAEDAIIIGRQNCDEFAMGSTNESSFFGPARNAQDKDKVPGGSSGGSAVAVQADLCLLSIGSDTGGSVRQPASFCGVVGLKPTYSRISRYGLVAYASSFDCIGLIGKNPEDIARALEIIAGEDAYDSTVSSRDVPAYSQLLRDNPPKLNIAYLTEGLESKLVQEEVRQTLRLTLDELKEEGHEIKPLEFPLLEYILPVYYILTTAEASSNLARYDGVRYGFRSSSHQTGASKDLV